MQRSNTNIINYTINPLHMTPEENAHLYLLLQSKNDETIFPNSSTNTPCTHSVTYHSHNRTCHTTYHLSLTHPLIKYQRRKNESEYRYAVLGKILGHGAQGCVASVEATIKMDDKLVVKIKNTRIAKILKPHTLQMTASISRDVALNEYIIMNRLANYFKPHTISYSKNNQLHILISHRFSGIDLGKILYSPEKKIYQLSLAQRIKLASLLLQGLKRLHDAGIIHRDIKPDNILVQLDTSNNPISADIIDMGLAREIDLLQTQEVRSPGTPRFASPEAWAGHEINQPADIYAMGKIFWLIFCNLDIAINFIFGPSWFNNTFSNTQPPIEKLFDDNGIDIPHDIRAIIYYLLTHMNDRNPATRATIVECLSLLDTIKMASKVIRFLGNPAHANLTTSQALPTYASQAGSYSPVLFAAAAAAAQPQTESNITPTNQENQFVTPDI